MSSDLEEKLAHLLSVLERTRGRADDEVPTEPGVCFANGFVRGAAKEKEWLIINYHMGGLPKDREDGSFTIHSLNHIGPEKTTLLQRAQALDVKLRQGGGTALRKGHRVNDGLGFDEWLMRRPNDRGLNVFDFRLEMNSDQGMSRPRNSWSTLAAAWASFVQRSRWTSPPHESPSTM